MTRNAFLRMDLENMDLTLYKATFSEPRFSRWFEKVPWCLTGALQNPSDLKRTLFQEFERFSVFKQPIRFSLITALYNTPVEYLEELIWSLKSQSWPHWQLILLDDGSPNPAHHALAENEARTDSRIHFVKATENRGISGGRNEAFKYASGDFVAILDHDDMLHPQTLGIYARYLLENKNVNFLFSNELKITADSTQVSDFFVKPDFDWSTLLRTNYICHFTAIKKSLCDQLLAKQGILFKKDYDGCEDHEWFLQLSRLPEFSPAHLHLFTYYWRKAPTSTSTSIETKPYVYERGKQMLKDYWNAIHTDFPVDLATVESLPEKNCGSFFSLAFVPHKKVKVIALVPFRDATTLTQKALSTLGRQDLTHIDLEIVAIDNRSNERSKKEMANFLQNWRSPAKLVLREFDEPFNFNRLHNETIRELGDSDFLLFMNNDVELLSPDTLRRLVGESLINPRHAVCGLRLLYPGEKEIQHGGIKFVSPHMGLGYYTTTHIGGIPQEFAHDEHCASGVTFACALVDREKFVKLGGMDELYCPNGYGDTTFCLKAQEAGYSVFYLGSLVATHHETKTRPHLNEDAEIYFANLKYRNLHTVYLNRIRYEQNPSGTSGLAGGGLLEMPLRYRLVDKVNDKLKNYLGPFHRMIKRELKKR